MFYKRRLKLKNKCSIVVQKYLKGKVQRHKSKKLKSIYKGSYLLKQYFETKQARIFMKLLEMNAKAVRI